MKRLFTILVVSALFAFSGNVFAQNLINNGGFETGDFSGWTQSGDTSFSGVCQSFSPNAECSGRLVHSGTYMSSFGPADSNGFLTQNVATTAGANYTVSFWLQLGVDDTPNDFSVSFGGVTLLSKHDDLGFGWTQFTFDTTALSNSSALQFSFYEPQDYWDLDDVFVTKDAPIATPEPASLGLLFSGLTLGAGVLRKFRS